MIIKVKEGQTIYDIAIQYYGDILNVQMLLDDNDINRNTILYSGQELKIREAYSNEISTFFENKSVNSSDNIKMFKDLENEDFSVIKIDLKKDPYTYNEWIVEDGQSVYDIATMFYGSPDKVEKIFEMNPELNYNSVLYSGQKIKLKFNKAFESKNYYVDNIVNNTDVEYRTFSELTAKILQVGYETSDSLGFIYVDVYGGTRPYTFLWSNGTTTQNLLAITTGTYTLTVTDDDGTQVTVTTFVQYYNPNTKYLVAPAVPREYYTGPYDNILTSNGDRILINIKTTELL